MLRTEAEDKRKWGKLEKNVPFITLFFLSDS